MTDEAAVARFLYDEAELLDCGAYDRWFALFTEDARYWVPSHPQQTDPAREVSLFYEDPALMHARIGRLRHPRALGLPVRTSHLIGNVRTDGNAPNGDLVVRSRFQMIEFVAEEQRLHGGAVMHHLVADGDSWKIRLKRVDLANAGGVFELLQAFF
ncbi:MAG TPA: aromatic-ring-hydroxylating dioxygenase subunit beta [Acetobacteraceae bacterium]|nr:aromatic-ring-hydroxylating dioxygenase subunit beta [Acetobacteraceae bacterium]